MSLQNEMGSDHYKIYTYDALLKIKLVAEKGQIRLGIHPEIHILSQCNHVPNFMLLPKSALFGHNLLHICPAIPSLIPHRLVVHQTQ